LEAEAAQRRERNLAAIQTVFVNIAQAFTSAAQNPKDVLVVVGFCALFALCIYVARETAKLGRTLLESMLGKPSLVRETTRTSFWKRVSNCFFVSSAGDKTSPKNINNTNKAIEKCFEDLVLPSQLKGRILSVATSARKAHRHGAPHRHILLFGPPGTGKTFVAKKLAQCIGLDYALMSGGDVGPLGSDAVTQIHALFQWARFSPKGVLLFIDEAEAFLGSRCGTGTGGSTMGEHAHNALNAMLYNTGSERRDFMLVLATNR
jgi:ATPase family AAA domain-containing protein 3A/B